MMPENKLFFEQEVQTTGHMMNWTGARAEQRKMINTIEKHNLQKRLMHRFLLLQVIRNPQS